MEVWEDTVKFLGSEVAFSPADDRGEGPSAERSLERNADQQSGARSEASSSAWTQVAGGRKRRFARRTKERAGPGGGDPSELPAPVDLPADQGGLVRAVSGPQGTRLPHG